MDEKNGWNEYGRFVLEELKKLNTSQERAADKIAELRDSIDQKLNNALASIREDLGSLQSKVAHFEPNKVVQLQVEMENLKAQFKDQEDRMRKVELSVSTFYGKWAIISTIGAVLLSAIVGLIFSVAKAETKALPPKSAISSTNNP